MRNTTALVLLCLFVGCSAGKQVLSSYPDCFPGHSITVNNRQSNLPFPKLFHNQQFGLSLSCRTPKAMPLVALTPDNVTQVISTVKANSDIDIVGETYRMRPVSQYRELNRQFYSGGYYLVHVVGSRSLWDGWVSKRPFPEIHLKNEEPDFASFADLFIISPNNRFVAYIEGPVQGSIAVASKYGRVVSLLNIDQIRKQYENATQIELLGWSANGRYVWFDTYMESEPVCFGRIDLRLSKVKLFDLPPNFGDREYIIDFNTGQIVYFDQPNSHFQMLKDAEAFEKHEPTIYHLYATYLGSGKARLIATNEHKEFDLKRVDPGTISYFSSELDARALVSLKE